MKKKAHELHEMKVKSEARSTKFETNSKFKCSKFQTKASLYRAHLFLFWSFIFWSLGFVSDFGFRISDFKPSRVFAYFAGSFN